MSLQKYNINASFDSDGETSDQTRFYLTVTEDAKGVRTYRVNSGMQHGTGAGDLFIKGEEDIDRLSEFLTKSITEYEEKFSALRK